MPDINKHEVDIENLFKQNELDLNSIKELYKRIEELGEKISQIKYIDSTLANKLKKEYESLKKKILDENIQVEISNNYQEVKSKVDKLSTNMDTSILQIEENQNLIKKNGVNVELFGAKGDGVTDDSVAIQEAIDYAQENNINIVRFDSKTYICNNVSGYSGLQLHGVNKNTILKRSGNNSCIKFVGTPIDSQHDANSHISNFGIYNIKFSTGDLNTDIPCVNLTCVGNFTINNCGLHGQGKQLLLWEAFDSRIYNTNFEWGGRANGLSAIELRSTNGGDENNPTYEYTNNIYFDGCRFETYTGTALETTGSNTNLIFINNCKFESRQVKYPHIKISDVNGFKIKNTFIVTNGSETHPPLSLIKVKSSQFDLSFMNIANNIPINKSIISITNNSIMNDFVLKFNNLSTDYFNNSNYVIYTDMTETTFETNTFNITCPLVDSGVKYFSVKAENKMIDRVKVESTNKTPTIILKRNDISGQWELGKVTSDGFKIIHNDGTTDNEVITINSNDEIFLKKMVHLDNSIHLWNSGTTPWTSGYGTMYVDTTNEKSIATSMGGTWRYESSASSVPTTGTWKARTIVWNNNPSIGNPIGWICTESGTPGIWRKFGTIEEI